MQKRIGILRNGRVESVGRKMTGKNEAAQAAAPPASVLGKTHWRVRGRRVFDIAPRTSGHLRTVDTAGYIYYIGKRRRQRRIAARGAACIDMTFDMLIPELGGIFTKMPRRTSLPSPVTDASAGSEVALNL